MEADKNLQRYVSQNIRNSKRRCGHSYAEATKRKYCSISRTWKGRKSGILDPATVQDTCWTLKILQTCHLNTREQILHENIWINMTVMRFLKWIIYYIRIYEWIVMKKLYAGKQPVNTLLSTRSAYIWTLIQRLQNVVVFYKTIAIMSSLF